MPELDDFIGTNVEDPLPESTDVILNEGKEWRQNIGKDGQSRHEVFVPLNKPISSAIWYYWAEPVIEREMLVGFMMYARRR